MDTHTERSLLCIMWSERSHCESYLLSDPIYRCSCKVKTRGEIRSLSVATKSQVGNDYTGAQGKSGGHPSSVWIVWMAT